MQTKTNIVFDCAVANHHHYCPVKTNIVMDALDPLLFPCDNTSERSLFFILSLDVSCSFKTGTGISLDPNTCMRVCPLEPWVTR